ncbi:hypothetical protein ACNTMW_29320 [Planosporangium sp. 12N6]|uniref:hypothetical protein n=1 Tax=Planosporangium spinosum TaxID=3402278 RepID=UPI003CEC1DEF
MAPTDDTFAPALLGTFNAAIETLETGVRNIHTAWDQLTQAVEHFIAAVRKKLEEDHWWNKVVEWFTDEIKDALKGFQAAIEEARKKVGEILDKLEKTLNGSVPVLSLFQVGLDWSTQVNTHLSEIMPDVAQSGEIDTWHGPAHDTYKSRETYQNDAVGQAIDEVKSLSKWLSDVATANVHFVTDLAKQAIPVVDEITVVIGDLTEATGALDPLSAQEAANDLSETLGKIVASIVEYLISLADRLADVLNLVGEVASEHSDHRAFSGGHWPQAVNA